MTADSTALVALDDAPRPAWIAYHVFYGGNPMILLRRCILPLVDDLRAADRLQRYFFMNYWLEGSHVRLRLRPATAADADWIRSHVPTAIEDYLRTLPSLHPMAELESENYYDELFAGEFTQAERRLYFTEDGKPRFAPNNSVQLRPYEPELGRYGGPVGIEIAEEFFEVSSDMAARLLRQGNLGARTIQLGIATELMAVFVAAMLPDRDRMRDFLLAYHTRWTSTYGMNWDYTSEEGRAKYHANTVGIRTSVLPLVEAVRHGRSDQLVGFVRDWAQAGHDARARLEREVSRGTLTFELASGELHVPQDLDEAAWMMGHSFVHMMNNRLMVSIADEAFIAFQLIEALDAAAAEGGA